MRLILKILRVGKVGIVCLQRAICASQAVKDVNALLLWNSGSPHAVRQRIAHMGRRQALTPHAIVQRSFLTESGCDRRHDNLDGLMMRTRVRRLGSYSSEEPGRRFHRHAPAVRRSPRLRTVEVFDWSNAASVKKNKHEEKLRHDVSSQRLC